MTDEPKKPTSSIPLDFTSPEARARRDAARAKEHSKLDRLRLKMLKAHPDKGGTHEAFLKAKAAYEKARGWALGGRKS